MRWDVGFFKTELTLLGDESILSGDDVEVRVLAVWSTMICCFDGR